MTSASPLSPTFYGHIASTQDALLLFELCLSGTLNHVTRRAHDRKRASLIKSENVFIYEEHSSGIKPWTDGVPWSPSRILGNFLDYRELERPFPPGEKKRAMKRSKRFPGISEDVDEELFTSDPFAKLAKTNHSQLEFENRGSLDKIFRRHRRGPRRPRSVDGSNRTEFGDLENYVLPQSHLPSFELTLHPIGPFQKTFRIPIFRQWPTNAWVLPT